MTIEQFETQEWTALSTFKYKDTQYEVAAVNFEEALIGYCSDYADDIQWVRCENITIRT